MTTWKHKGSPNERFALIQRIRELEKLASIVASGHFDAEGVSIIGKRLMQKKVESYS